MHLKKAFALAWLASLALLAAGSQARQPRGSPNECPANAPFLNAGASRQAGIDPTVFRRYCYTDKSGSYALLLGAPRPAAAISPCPWRCGSTW
jgi:hypothetical protein